MKYAGPVNGFLMSVFIAFLLLAPCTGYAVTGHTAMIKADCTGEANCFTSLTRWQEEKSGIDFGDCPPGDLVCADLKIILECYNDRPEGVEQPGLTIDGWTTDAEHNITIRTPLSERHSGKVKENGAYTGFALRLTGDRFTGNLNIRTDYTVIDGLIFDMTEGRAGIYLGRCNAGGKHIIYKNNISYNGYFRHIYLGDYQATTVYNNFFINDISVGSGSGAVDCGPGNAAFPHRIYNNSMYFNGNFKGIGGDSIYSVIYAYNNICQKTKGSYHESASFTGLNKLRSGNNIGNDSFAVCQPNVIYAASEEIGYVSTVSGEIDLHLTENSAAVDAGVARGFINDIDGDPRTGAFDIGADERPSGRPATAPAASISAARLYINAGESTVLRWRTENAATVTVTGVTSPAPEGAATVTPSETTVYTVTAGGAEETASAEVKVFVMQPAAEGDVVERICKIRSDCTGEENCYPSLAAWQADMAGVDFAGSGCAPGDLTCKNTKIIVEFYHDWPDGLQETGAISLEGWDTDETRNITLRTPASERHTGKLKEDNAYTGFALRFPDHFKVYADYTEIDGLIFDLSDNSCPQITLGGYRADGRYVTYKNNISYNGCFRHMILGDYQAATVYNNFFINDITRQSSYGAIDTGASNISYPHRIYNNSMLFAGNYRGLDGGSNKSGLFVYNNLCQKAEKSNYAPEVSCFSNLNESQAGNNISTDSFAGTGQVARAAAEEIGYASTAAGETDLHLTANSVAANRGADVAFISRDIDGDLRESPFDIGADEMLPGGVNHPPVFDPAPEFTAEAGIQAEFLTAAADPDGDTLTFSLSEAPDGMAIDPASGKITWTPGQDQTGIHSFTVRASDDRGRSAEQSFTAKVDAASDRTPPSLTLSVPAEAGVSGVIHISARASDNTGVAAVTFYINGLEVKKIIDPPYEMTWNAPSRAGESVVVKVTASDAAGNTAEAEAAVSITAEADAVPPVINGVYLPSSAAPGETIALRADVTDDRAVAQVRFIPGNADPVTVPAAPYETALAVPADAAGSIPVKVEAEDAAGNVASAERTLSITAAPDEEPPVITLSVPETVRTGGSVVMTADASDNRGVLKVVFTADGIVIGDDAEAPYDISYPVPASKIPGSQILFSAEALDFSGNRAAAGPHPVLVKAPETGFITGAVYDEAGGLPLSDAAVHVISVNGEAPESPSEGASDISGGWKARTIEGTARIRIEKPGFTRVFRQAATPAGGVVRVKDARLTALSSGQNLEALSGGLFEFKGENARLTVPAGAFSENASLSLTRLSGQGLPHFLPAGWSPVSAFHIGPAGKDLGVSISLALSGTENTGGDAAGLTAVRWDEENFQWVRVGARVLDDGAEITVFLNKTGAVALVRPDDLPGAPSAPETGVPLTAAVQVPMPAGAVADILPSPEVLFAVSDAVSDVRAVITNNCSPSAEDCPLFSGAFIRVKFSETYRRTDGSMITPGTLFRDMVLYREADGLQARFTVSPSVEFEAAELAEGVIRLEALRPEADSGTGIATPSGAVVAAGGLSLAIPAGAVTEETAVSLEVFTELPSGLADNTAVPAFAGAAGFSVDFSGTELSSGAVLSVGTGAADADGIYLLVHPQTFEDGSRYIIAAAGSADGTRVVFDGKGLPFSGVRESGVYYMMKLASPGAFITGSVTAGGSTAAGAVVETESLPFAGLVRSDAPGYLIVSLPGDAAVSAKDPVSGAVASGSVNLSSAGETVTLDLTLAAVSSEVVSVTPADGAGTVSVDAIVTLAFSAKIDPSTLTTETFGVTSSAGTVPGVPSLRPDGRTAVFRPDAALPDNTDFTISLTSGIRDIYGNALIPFTSTFRTEDVTPPEMPEPGQITLPIPENGTTTLTGTAGAAEAGALVTVFINGSGTTSVTADSSGGFSVTIDAALTDNIIMEFRDDAGNVTEYDPGPFKNEDGAVVIGADGGTAEGSGDVEAVIPEGAVPDGTVVKIDAVDEAKLAKEIPGFFEFLGCVNLNIGGVTAEEELKVSIPVPDGVTLGEDAQILVFQEVDFFGSAEFTLVNIARVKEIDGVFRIETASPPFCGLLMSGLFAFVSPPPDEPLTFGTVIPSSHLGSVRVLMEAGFRLVDHPGLPGYKTIIAMPADHTFTVTPFSSEGVEGDTKTFDPPSEPFGRLLIPAAEDLTGELGVAEVKTGSDSGVLVITEDGTAAGVTVDSDLSLIFTKQIAELGDTNVVLEAIDADGNKTVVPGAVEQRYVEVDGEELLRGAVFSPETRLKYGTEYRLSVRDINDFDPDSPALSREVRTFRTFRPRVIGDIDVPYASGLDLLETDEKKPRLAVASGALYQADPDAHGVVLIDVSDPSRPEILTEAAIPHGTFGVLGIDDADVPGGLLSGPAVAGVSFRRKFRQPQLRRVQAAFHAGYGHCRRVHPAGRPPSFGHSAGCCFVRR